MDEQRQEILIYKKLTVLLPAPVGPMTLQCFEFWVTKFEGLLADQHTQ